MGKRSIVRNREYYSEDSAGSLMTIEYVGLKKEMTVRQAIQYIQELESINTHDDQEATEDLYKMAAMQPLEKESLKDLITHYSH